MHSDGHTKADGYQLIVKNINLARDNILKNVKI